MIQNEALAASAHLTEEKIYLVWLFIRIPILNNHED
jgi:hypothetical protein